MARKHYSQPIVPGQPPGRGLTCPDCGCRHFRVIYARAGPHAIIQRRRECRHCGRRVTTIERMVRHDYE